MRAVARQREKFTHDLKVRKHRLTADEPEDEGGDDMGPSPQELLAASLASCTAITIEMYANRKGWDVGDLEVEVDYEFGEGEVPTRYDVVLKLPEDLSGEQVERLRVIAGKCPVHRALIGNVEITDQVERVSADTR
jgi:putative redox protein